MTTYDTLFSIRRLWIILAASMVVMFGTLLYFGGADLPSRAADSGGRAQRRRPDALHARGHRARPERLAIHGRHAARLDLGPRQLRRAGLVGGLAASRSASRCSSCSRATRAAAATTRSPRRSRRACRAILQQEMRTNTYDAARGRRHGQRRPRARDRFGRAALFRSFQGGSPEARSLARAVRVPDRRRAHGGGSGGAQRVLLLDGMGREHAAAGRLDHLHEQLAARAARRQHADGRRVHVDVHFDLRAARGHRRARLVLREGIRHLAPRRRARDRLRAPGLHERDDGDAVDARDVVVLHGRDGAVRRAGAARHRHRALRGRRPRPLRPAAVGILPVCRHAHVAHAARRALDRDGVARDRPLRRAACSAGASRSCKRPACGSCSSASSSSSRARSRANGSRSTA